MCSQYRVDMEDLRTQNLILSVWHHDTFGRNSFLGEVDVDLSKWDFDHTRMNYFPLKSRVKTNKQTKPGSSSHQDDSLDLSFKFLTLLF